MTVRLANIMTAYERIRAAAEVAGSDVLVTKGPNSGYVCVTYELTELGVRVWARAANCSSSAIVSWEELEQAQVDVLALRRDVLLSAMESVL